MKFKWFADHYTNPEIIYHPQRLKDYPRLIILSTNMKNNIDEAFMRRFQSVIHFSSPKT